VCFAVCCDVARGNIELIAADPFDANAVDAACFFIDEAITVVIFAIACFGRRSTNCGLIDRRGIGCGFWFGFGGDGFVGVG
jgi:hypothetical protein